MKKILFLTFIAICISIITPSSMYALDITLGATTWYAQSEQYYTQNKDAYYMQDAPIKSEPAFLYGPTLAVRLSNDFSLTFVFLYGTFKTKRDYGTLKSDSKYWRNDSDLVLNYKLNDYFKIFAGVKYFSYAITPADTDNSTFRIKKIDAHTSYGAGTGLSATVPLVGSLFCLGTVSGLYLWGTDKVKIEDYSTGNNKRSVNNGYNEYGINSTLSLAYYIAPASTVISLGGRFQYLMADYKKNDIYLDSIKFTIYGVTLTATYTFSI